MGLWRATGSAAAVLLGCARVAVVAQDPGAWRIDPEPRLRIGWVDGHPETEFFDVVSVARLPDGGIAIAARGLSRIIVARADGTVAFSVGGAGDGPGEFADLARVLVDDDGHLYAFDARHQRITEWTGGGELIDTTPLARGGSDRPVRTVGRFRTGAWYARESTRVLSAPLGDVARDTVGFFRLGGDGAVGERIAQVPGAYSTQVMVGGRAAGRHIMFSPRALDARLGDCLLVMSGDVPDIRVLGYDGALRGDLRLPLPTRPTTDEDRASWIDGMIDSNDAPPAAAELVRRMGRALPMAERLPIAHGLLGDEGGFVWLERYAPPEGPSARWSVIDGEGVVVAEPELPDGLRLLAIEDDAVIGVWSDALDRQEVRVHELTRGEGDVKPPLADCR